MPSAKKKESWMKLWVGEGDFSFSACLARAFQPATSMVATSFDSKEELKNEGVADEDLKGSNQNATEVVEQTCLSPSLTDSGDKSLPDPTCSTAIGTLALHHEIIKDIKRLVIADCDNHVFPNSSSTIIETTLQPCAIGKSTLHTSASSGLLNDQHETTKQLVIVSSGDNIANSKPQSKVLGIEAAKTVELETEDDNRLKTNERRITHYNRFQKILLVGEGDFSFSACLARAFGSAINMVATSLDSKEELLTKHFTSIPHIRELKRLGCLVLHDIDVHEMAWNEALIDMKFDIIVFNFPHAGHFPMKCERHYSLINKHKKLIKGFFKSSSKMLSSEDGEVHVSHRDDYPYNMWQVEKLAKKAGLELIEKVEFRQSDYPGYHNKRGGGVKSNKKFPLGNLSFTFKFSPLLSIVNN